MTYNLTIEKCRKFRMFCIVQYCSFLMYFEEKQIFKIVADKTGLEKNGVQSHSHTPRHTLFVMRDAIDCTKPVNFRDLS